MNAQIAETIDSKAAKASTSNETAENFEHSLSELEALIGQLESGGLSLDDTVKHFAHGMALYDSCKLALEQAQLKVELLLKGASDMSARVPFDPQNP
jgi:exodeoxyribonuclease VII small subunit